MYRGDTSDLRFEEPTIQATHTGHSRFEHPLHINEDTFQLVANTSQPNVVSNEGVEDGEASDTDDETNSIEQDSASELPRSPKASEGRGIRRRPTKIQKISRHGKRFPSIPTSTMKKLASKFARSAGQTRSKLNKDCLNAIDQATDWFFEQLGDDLGSYAEHAGRKTIDETDVVALMRR